MNITDITRTETTEKAIRFAPYCRVSSDSEDQLHSFAAQIKYYKDYERQNPQYELVDIYADEGITGTSMKNRDEFNRLIRDCTRGKIDRIIVKSVSRFARNTKEPADRSQNAQGNWCQCLLRGTGHRYEQNQYGDDRNIPRYGSSAGV